MSNNIGIVSNVQRLEGGVDKNGKPYSKFQFTVNGKSYKVNQFSIKTRSKSLADGMNVSVREEQNGQYKNVIVEDAPAGAVPSQAPTQAAPAARSYGKSVEEQAIIEAQSSRYAALEFLKLAFETGAIPKTKFTGKGDGEKVLYALLEHTAQEMNEMVKRIAKGEASPFDGVAPVQQPDSGFKDDTNPLED